MRLNTVKLNNGKVLGKNAVKVISDYIGRNNETGEPITIEQIVQEYELLSKENRIQEAMEQQENIYEMSDELKIENLVREGLINEQRNQKMLRRVEKLIKGLNDSDMEFRKLKTIIIYNTYTYLNKSQSRKSEKANKEIKSILRSYPALKKFHTTILDKLGNY